MLPPIPPEYYIHGSGVIAVVVYGLYGASTYLYGFSSKGLRAGAFFKFLDVLSFMLNGMVFFYVGSSIVNFFIRWGAGKGPCASLCYCVCLGQKGIVVAAEACFRVALFRSPTCVLILTTPSPSPLPWLWQSELLAQLRAPFALSALPCSLSGELFSGGSASALLQILQGLPVILVAMFLLRGGLIWLEAPLLSLLGPPMSWQVRGIAAATDDGIGRRTTGWME